MGPVRSDMCDSNHFNFLRAEETHKIDSACLVGLTEEKHGRSSLRSLAVVRVQDPPARKSLFPLVSPLADMLPLGRPLSLCVDGSRPLFTEPAHAL